MNATKLRITAVGIALVAVVALAVWQQSRAGRSTTAPPAGLASDSEQGVHEQEFRRQLAESTPMREYGYTISELRFTPDYKKAVVQFTHADTNTRPGWKFVLVSDDFGYYHGEAQQPFFTPGTARRPPIHLTATYPPR
jgi:hypothetical protein